MDAGSVIEEARDWSALFRREGAGGIGDGPALRKLGRVQEDLYARVVALNPDALVVTAPAEIAHADILTALSGKTLLTVPAYLTPIRAEYRLTDDEYTRPVAFASVKGAANRGQPFPAVIPMGDTGLRVVDLRDHGGTWHGWEAEGTLEFYYVPRPATPENLRTELTAPDWMRSKVVTSLALWMGARNGALSPGLAEAAREAEEGFQQTVMAQQGGTSWYVHEGG